MILKPVDGISWWGRLQTSHLLQLGQTAHSHTSEWKVEPVVIQSRRSSREAAMLTALEGVHVEWRSTVGSLLVTTMSWVLWMTYCGPQPCALLAGCQSTGTQEPTKRAFPAAMASPESTTGDPWPRGAAMFIPPQTRSREPRSWPAPISVLLTMPKPLTVWITINCGKCLHFMLNAEDSKLAFALKVCTVCSEKTDKSRSNIMSYTF